MTIYTSKKNGKSYVMQPLENGKFQLINTEDNTDIVTTTESVLKRWYKKSVVVDFATAEPKPAEEPNASKPSKKVQKVRKPRAKTYEEQKWGLGHQRMSLEAFCNLFDISDLEVEYDHKNQQIIIKAGEKPCVRRAWPNELTGSVWFRFKNYEYELTDVAYVVS